MSDSTVTKTYGTVSATERKEMSGLEFVQGLADGRLPLNTMAQTLGYDVTEVVNGRVVVTATPNGHELNPAGTVHGGLAATLLDSCGAHDSVGLAEGRRLDHARVQGFVRAAHHTGDRAHHGRGRCFELRQPGRYRRRADYRCPGQIARSRHDYVPDI